MHQQAQHIIASIEHQFGEEDKPASWKGLITEFPWYPTGWLGYYTQEEQPLHAWRQLGLYVHHPLRLQLVGHACLHRKKTENNEVAADSLTAPLPKEISEPFAPVETPPSKSSPTENTVVIDAPATVAEAPSTAEAAPISVPGDPGFVFQPYHTVDYFAALGIKIDPQALQTTRLDRQLKSFTQWLKTMKKLENDKTEGKSDPVVDVQAANSVLVNEVVTEAMAEVLAKQGKLEQALALYAKLTLLHPEKTAFFAAQIQKIKAQQ